ncbi:hypothetical protein NEOLEDRAFT_1063870, partial [Neolentinus lepideus HHB14362 ss-1]
LRVSNHRLCRADRFFCVNMNCRPLWSVNIRNLAPCRMSANRLSDSTIASSSCSWTG